jgi:DNA-binding MarR family transcriptional regulator
MTVLEATSASLAAFVKALKRLTEEGMLIVEQGKADRRVRNYDLAPDVRALLAENLNRLLASGNAN